MTPALQHLAAVDLPTLDAQVALRVRADNKHLLPATLLDPLLERLARTHAVLEIDGRRTFAYDTVYFDTPDLRTAREHLQGRRARFKCRTRLYADTGACAVELKQRDGRGATVKRRSPHAAADHGRLTPEARAFLAEHLSDVPPLEPVLRTTYTRVTLAGPAERVTIDTDLAYEGAGLRPEWVLVETKSPRGQGIADGVLRDLGSRPVALSKYLAGVGLTRMPAPPNDYRRLLRQCFARA